jgi:Gon7 family
MASSKTPKVIPLSAAYISPTGTKTFTYAVPSISTASTEDKTLYLAALRTAVPKLQDEVNEFLTKKMDEDKAKLVTDSKIDEKAEEDNYGEEVVEEDD